MIRPDRPREEMLPESEQNPPEDKSMGWKPWGPGQRWWMGKQWGESYIDVPMEERP